MTFSGIVTRNDGPRFWVDSQGTEIPCILRGKLKREFQRVTSLVVVGDEVEFDQLPDGTGVIEQISPRRSELSRLGFHGYVHVIAANIEQLIIVTSAQQPRFKLHLAERFLAIARRGNMEPTLVVNKCDLEHDATIAAWVEPLVKIGVRVILTSTIQGRGIEELRTLLTGRTSVFAGQSGVGKSSLVNALYGTDLVRTNAVSDSSTKGRHTTTSSRLYRLPEGGYLADTPGIRSLELFDEDTNDEALDELFPEITQAAARCKFRDCTHTHEPNCAVKAAVARGQIPQARYDNFKRMAGSQ